MSMRSARRGSATTRVGCRTDAARAGGGGPPRRGRPAAWATALGAMLLVLGCGCAYYNTFYNAKQLFKKAETERTMQGEEAGAGSYQRCIDKCLQLLKFYPKSKYADDALFLIGMSHLYRGEYVQARASFQDLADRFPNSDYTERVYYNMGLAALRQGDPGGAAQAFATLQQRFPNSPMNVEAVFRTAEASLDANDYESARQDLRAFIRDHQGSTLVADAQLRIARTYYDEARYEEAQREYALLLKEKISPEVRFEAELNSALALRAQAEMILSDPAMQAAGTRAGAPGAAPAPGLRGTTTGGTAPAGGAGPPSARGSLPDSLSAPDSTSVPDSLRAPGETPSPDETVAPDETAAPDSASLSDSMLDEEETTSDSASTIESTSAGASAAPGTPAGAAPGPPAALAAAPGALPDTAATAALSPAPPEDPAVVEARAAERRRADEILARVRSQLESLRKPAAKIGKQADLKIELAVTQALQGTPDAAIADLDQIARTQPRTDISAQAFFQIGEIQRRLGDLEKARVAYEAVQREKRDSPLAAQAQKKSAAILARAAALEQLKQAPEALRAWRVARGLEAPGPVQDRPPDKPPDKTQDKAQDKPQDKPASGAQDSLEARIGVESKFEEMANRMLQVAEIDLLELDQPLVAQHEFQMVLRDYPGSLQCPRAAFAMAWIYEHRLRDLVRARPAYEAVVRDYPGTPQASEAALILERPAPETSSEEVIKQSPQP